MRKNLLILAIAASAMAMQADVLSPEQALGRAMGNGPAKAKALDGAPKLVYTEMLGGQPTSYVFENKQGGYMLLSADDAAAPVLGYSDEGTFDKENIPDNMRYWLEAYAKEIAYARENGISYQAPAYASNWAAIAPLCATKWNQDAPYNDLCPVSKQEEGKHAYTGCVATAMAQLMKYHNYPPVGKGNKTNYSNGFPETKINFADYPFDWDNMTNTYDTKSTEKQKLAVAQLMLACGMSVDMDYGLDGSGATSETVATALVNYFNYDQACHFPQRDYHSMTEWNEMAYNELKNVGPVLYSGVSSGGGHCFIVDGYDGEGYFHLNWGWGGMSDGYFLLSALDPYSQGIGGSSTNSGFNSDQGMLIGAKKPVNGSKKFYDELCMSDKFTINQSSSTLGGSISIPMPFINYTPWTVSGTLGILVTSSSGSNQFCASTQQFDLMPLYGYNSNLVISPKLPTSLSNGSYTVTPAWKSTDGTIYPIHVKVYLCRSYTMTVNGNNVAFKANEGTPQLKATNLQVVSKALYAGTAGKYRVTFTNSSNVGEYYGQVVVGISSTTPVSGTKPTYTGTTFMVDVAPGETVEMPFEVTFTKAPAGKYKMAFYDPNNNYALLGSAFDVTFQAMPSDEDSQYSVTDFGFVGGETTNINPNNLHINFTVSCSKGIFYASDLRVFFIRKMRNGTLQAQGSGILCGALTLLPGESKTIELTGSYNLANNPNWTYCMALGDGSAYKTAKIFAGPMDFSLLGSSGIDDVNADEAVEVRYYNLQGMPVDFEQAAPGVYVRMSIYSDGTTSTDKVRK